MATWIESIKYRSRGDDQPIDPQTSENIKLFNAISDILAAHDKIRKDQV